MPMTIPTRVRRLMGYAVALVGGLIVAVYYFLEAFWRLLIWIDQGLNVLIGGFLLNPLLQPQYRFGDPDETLSSVLGKNVAYAAEGSCRACQWLCRMLDKIDPDHCRKSIEADEGDIV